MSKIEYKQDNLTIHNADCMEVMSKYEDNYFDLAVVDPPYGINRDGGETGKNWKVYEKKGWDTSAPNESYFKELFRVSKNQVIWGANYYPQFLPPSMGWIMWDKGQKLTMSDGELAFTSFQKALRIKVLNRCTIGQEGGNIHPTQKPVKLYNWIYQNYAQEGQKILDTHLGSGSNAISAHYAKMGEFVGCELDKDYYEASIKRIYNETRQLELF
jgi:site-specific DNA-methyltransferase (adenine-specific)